MKKQQVFTLELEDDGYDYADQAYLFFHTSAPCFAFADDMNRLYGLALARCTDMELRGGLWPVYAYRHPLSKLLYRIVERPSTTDGSAPHWAAGHKLLLVQGEDAPQAADAIEADFGSPATALDEGDHTAMRRQAILGAYQQSLMPVSRLMLGETPVQPLSRKAAKERAELEALVYDILDYLDSHGEQI